MKYKRKIIRKRGRKMKQNALLKLLKKNNWYLERHGGNHDIYTNGECNIAVPRHPNINERLARSLINKLELK